MAARAIARLFAKRMRFPVSVCMSNPSCGIYDDGTLIVMDGTLQICFTFVRRPRELGTLPISRGMVRCAPIRGFGRFDARRIGCDLRSKVAGLRFLPARLTRVAALARAPEPIIDLCDGAADPASGPNEFERFEQAP